MKNQNLTYKASGVDIEKTNKLVKYISSLARSTEIPGSKIKNFSNIGGFGSVFDIGKLKIKNPLIVTSTDGVGTKLEIANELKNWSTVGIDLVAMCVNDIIVQGARPIIFLDYIALPHVNKKKYKQILRGIAKGCRLAGCALTGGETAEMPGIYTKDKFDLAGFSVGIVDKNKIIDGSKIKIGDQVLAVPSSGAHSNGYSLIRRILKKNKKKINLSELLIPTKIYVKEILKLNKKKLINACAHITGGGLVDNIPRVIQGKFSAKINLSLVRPNNVMRWIKKSGVNSAEMIKTFNCGVGFIIISKKKNLNKIKSLFSKKFQPYVIGEIIKKTNKNSIFFNGSIDWS